MPRIILALVAVIALWPVKSMSQELVVGTVTRPPFSMSLAGTDLGFSIDLWDALAQSMDQPYQIERFDTFSGMLSAVETGEVDLAIANISITAAREQVMDFSQPIFSSGLQIMTHVDNSGLALWNTLFKKELILSVILAFAALLGVGMLMWLLERRHQEYFDQPAKKAMFPAFWWALNLVVNGGFEERVPRTSLGRLMGVAMVITSLFFVSVFVAYVTSAMTVEAITTSINSVNDLYGKRVGTVAGSTAAGYMDKRDLDYVEYDGLDQMLAGFEGNDLDAVIFDAPILAYYVKTRAQGRAQMNGAMFLRENYGIAAATGSPLTEKINRSLLRLRESGQYEEIYESWFGLEPQ
ncbi:transporter substrate-binding domain-containing protein [Thalassovita sp.]|uniref:transporter substrate-binding domain-containing protein n=1 Tax=Thalassovita sp. TaxID=1979401 RepID=UPI0028812C58|nr:transporter substrate-binding domain-containing protein [Thalassovita sp.]MDF1802613.1 transporter substrate-binding domain-containing protein [Thalassovita sp.]